MERQMFETSKARKRRLSDGFFQYCKGKGIDIGCGNDPLLPWIDKHDLQQGDATYMKNIKDEEYDFVYSSHCLEDIVKPIEALNNWFRILKTDGYLILYLPHRDLYEKNRILPSKWNHDHKFFLLPNTNDPPHTWSLEFLISKTDYQYNILYIKTCNEGHTITDPNIHSDGEYSIEAVIKKLDSQ